MYKMLTPLQSPSDDRSILVLGDLLIDEYEQVLVERVSPEGGHLVLNAQGESLVESRLGGAGNVALRLVELGRHVDFFACESSPEAGRELESAQRLPHLRITRDDCRRFPPLKRRVMAGNQVIHRRDVETSFSESCPPYVELVRAQEVSRYEAIYVADYVKGTLSASEISDLCSAAAKAGTLILVDSKRPGDIQGDSSTIFKMNQLEFESGFNLRIGDLIRAGLLEDAFREVGAKLGVSRLAITLGGKGAITWDGTSIEHADSAPSTAVDVNGAGDVYGAVLLAACCSGLSLHSANRIAVEVSGLFVTKTSLESIADLPFKVRFNSELRDVSQGQLAALGDVLKRPLVFTNGCFDLLHPGHVELLFDCRRIAASGTLVVGLNSDASVSKIKGASRPIMPQDARALLLRSIAVDPIILVFEQPSPERLIDVLEVDILVKGADYHESEILGGDSVKSRGGRVVTVPLRAGMSSTSIIEKCRERVGDA